MILNTFFSFLVSGLFTEDASTMGGTFVAAPFLLSAFLSLHFSFRIRRRSLAISVADFGKTRGGRTEAFAGRCHVMAGTYWKQRKFRRTFRGMFREDESGRRVRGGFEEGLEKSKARLVFKSESLEEGGSESVFSAGLDTFLIVWPM